jgi:aminopeptidase-like protein
VNLNPECEPQLGRRGLFRAAGGRKSESADELALLWVLNLSDGRHTLLDIAERSGMHFPEIRAAADALIEVELLGAAA